MAAGYLFGGGVPAGGGLPEHHIYVGVQCMNTSSPYGTTGVVWYYVMQHLLDFLLEGLIMQCKEQPCCLESARLHSWLLLQRRSDQGEEIPRRGEIAM